MEAADLTELFEARADALRRRAFRRRYRIIQALTGRVPERAVRARRRWLDYVDLGSEWWRAHEGPADRARLLEDPPAR